jgi:hypothetical protein
VDYKSFLEMGNVNDQTIEEIWNSKKFNQFRNDHIGGLRKSLNPCNRCFI